MIIDMDKIKLKLKQMNINNSNIHLSDNEIKKAIKSASDKWMEGMDKRFDDFIKSETENSSRNEYDKLIEQRNELLEALKSFVDSVDKGKVYKTAKELIAKAESK